MLKKDLVLAAFTALLMIGAATPGVSADKVAISMAASINMLPTLVGIEKGYFTEADIEPELKPVNRGSIAIEALSSGSVQFAEAAHVTFFSAAAKGIPVVAVAVPSRGFYGKVVASNENAEVKTLADLKGKRIGIQVGTGVHTVFLMLLEKNGLKQSDFKISNLRVRDMPAAMVSGDTFDAVIGWEPGMQRIVQQGKGKEVISARQFEQWANITYPFILLTTKDFLDKNRDLVQRVVNVYARGQKFIRDNRDGAVAIYMEHLKKIGAKLDEPTARKMLFEVDRFGGVSFSEEDWADLPSTIDYLVKNKRISPLDLSKIVDRSIGEKAEASLK